MKLLSIWNSAATWQHVSSLKKNPKLAYRLLKYEKQVERELLVCQKMQDSLIYELAGVEPPKPGDVLIVNISDDKDKMQVLNARFNEFLQGDSDLDFIGMTLDELIDGLDEKDGNTLSENHIERLEPFFEPVAESVPAAE